MLTNAFALITHTPSRHRTLPSPYRTVLRGGVKGDTRGELEGQEDDPWGRRGEEKEEGDQQMAGPAWATGGDCSR